MQMMSGTPWETVTLTTLSKDRKLFPRLLAEARELAMRGQEGKLVIMTAWGTEWRPFGQPRRKRPLQSVVLEEGVAEKVEHDVKAFLDRRQWYADRGRLAYSSLFALCVTRIVQAYRTGGGTCYMAHQGLGSPLSSKLWLESWDTTFVC